MLRTRLIPILLLKDSSLIKTIKFNKYNYIGDPVNTCKIFNEKEVDELIFLDITASAENREPNYKVITDIASECFMPLCYGGGITKIDQVKRILEIGVEKISFNYATVNNPSLITEAAKGFGNQAVVASIDVKKNFWGKYEVVQKRATKTTGISPIVFAKRMESIGAGEILVTSVDREGTWDGYDIELIKQVTDSVNVPVIVNGGAGTLAHLEFAVKNGKASGLALGSMVVYQKKGMGVLINFPSRSEIEKVLI